MYRIGNLVLIIVHNYTCIMLYICCIQAAAASAETHDVRSKTVLAGSTCASAYKRLLEQVNVVCYINIIK
jgi:hypothetical protein